MCKYCDLSEYWGEDLPFEKVVNGKDGHYEITILDDVRYEQFSLVIDGTFIDLRVEINYCPICGRKL